MGFFSTAGSSKSDLIRHLLIERIKNDAEAKAQGFTPFMVRQMPDSQINGVIEAGICTIIESYSTLKRKGAPDSGAILTIENHRKGLGAGIVPESFEIMEYVNYRVAIEHNGAPLPDEHVPFCVLAATHFFAMDDDKGEASNSLKYAQLEKTTQKLEWIYALLVRLADAEMTEDEFYETVSEEVYIWADDFKERKKRADTFRLKAHLRDMK